MTRPLRSSILLLVIVRLLAWPGAAHAQQPCALSAISPVLTVPHARIAGPPSADPRAPIWTNAGTSELHRDCTHVQDYPDLLTTVRAFWTDRYIYFLFTAPYRTLN